MDLLIGTGNPAKFARYRTILGQFSHLRILSPADLDLQLPIVEDGQTAQANAAQKARSYAQTSGLPTLSIDEALYIPALSSHEQPGTNVRRYVGGEASDEALLAAFLDKTRGLAPDRRTAIWVYALCLVFPDGREFCRQVELHKVWAERPSLPILPGYPLSSLLLDPATGRALRDLSPEQEREHLRPVYEAVIGLLRAAGIECALGI